MLRLLTISLCCAIAFSSCFTQSHCKKMQKTNAKLIAGKADFGKKTKKWKKKQRY